MCTVLGNHLSTRLTLPFEDGQGQQLPSFQLQGQVKELRTGSCGLSSVLGRQVPGLIFCPGTELSPLTGLVCLCPFLIPKG